MNAEVNTRSVLPRTKPSNQGQGQELPFLIDGPATLFESCSNRLWVTDPGMYRRRRRWSRHCTGRSFLLRRCRTACSSLHTLKHQTHHARMLMISTCNVCSTNIKTQNDHSVGIVKFSDISPDISVTLCSSLVVAHVMHVSRLVLSVHYKCLCVFYKILF